jgi:hypothetical protein
MAELPDQFGSYSLGVPYPAIPRQACDLCLGEAPLWEWAIEVKMLRFMGNNGKLNDNILMHMLSPYPEDRSALTDCDKLRASGFHGRRAVIIYGYDYEARQMDLTIDAFEVLARSRGPLGGREVATFDGLIHPVHRRGRVFGWELL